MPELICENLSVNAKGHLCLAGQDTAELARQYGTPLYLMDEDRIRRSCRMYTEAFRRNFSAGSRVLYASKACSFKHMYRIMAEEGMGVDVVSAGELLTARSAGFDMKNVCFHSNNKTDADLALAMDSGIGLIAVDNEDELLAAEAEAEKRGIRQSILLRLTPGIEPHTYDAVNTGGVDSKFGVAIGTGQAAIFTRRALSMKHLSLEGFHCHVGSQVFEEDVFEKSARIMLAFIAETRASLGYTARVLDLGGGCGARYTLKDPVPDAGRRIDELAPVIHAECAALSLPEPDIMMEPGRSIVADAGMTLYTVGAVKRIPGCKTYVSVDGGMADNPRYALYGAEYSVYAPERMNEEYGMKCDLVGRCCESGDVLQPEIHLPEGLRRGDLVAVATTGAYNYSMASHYNRLPAPAVVMLRNGKSTVAVRRETPEDLLRYDV